MSTIRNDRVFISYASEHKAIAEHIALSLRTSGYTVFFDKDNLPPGMSFDDRIRTEIGACNAFIFLVSPEALSEGRYTLTELKLAREKWPNPSRAVLPVMIAPTGMALLPAYLKAVTILLPQGNVAAEVNAALEKMRRTLKRVYGIGALCCAILLAALAYLLFDRSRSTVDASVALSDLERGAAAAPSPVELFSATYGQSSDGKIPRISYRLPYLDLVHKGGPVQGVEAGGNALKTHFPELAVKVTNNTSRSLFLVEAAVQVVASEIEPEPIPVFLAKAMNAIQIDNAGWGDVIDPVLDFSVSELKTAGDLDLFAPVNQTVKRNTFSTHDNVRIAPFIPERLLDRPAVSVTGKLAYGPNKNRASLSFDTTILLDIKSGSSMPPSAKYPPGFFEAGHAPATVTIPISQSIKAGESDHFLITLATDKSSKNKLVISLKTTTGETLPAGELWLDLFVPRRIATQESFNGAKP